MTKRLIGWTVVKDGKAVGQSQSYYGHLSRFVTPVYNTIGKAKAQATRRGLPHTAVTEAFIEVPDDPSDTN